MESKLLGPRTSLFIGRIWITLLILSPSSESQTLILFTPHYAMSFFFQLDRRVGILAFATGRWKIQMILKESMSPWKNTFAIASTFVPLILSPSIFSLLAGSFRHMSVSLGQLLSRSAWVNLLPFRMILEWSFIRA